MQIPTFIDNPQCQRISHPSTKDPAIALGKIKEPFGSENPTNSSARPQFNRLNKNSESSRVSHPFLT